MPQPPAIRHLLKQIQKGDLDILKQYHRANPETHWKNIRYDSTGDTILHVSARLNLTNLIDYLFKEYRPKAVDCRNNDHKTALHEAAQFAQVESAELLVKSGADVNALKKADWTPLMLACTKCNERSLRVVEVLLDNGAILSCVNKDGWNVGHLLAREGCEDILRVVIARGLDTSVASKNGRTALHIAALHGHNGVIKILSGVEINTKDRCGNTPLHESVLGSHLSTFNLLVSLGADVSLKNRNGYTILHLAASVGCTELIKEIIEKELVAVNCAADGLVTALHCAARKHLKGTYERLVGLGADEKLRDAHGRMAKDYFKLNL